MVITQILHGKEKKKQTKQKNQYLSTIQYLRGDHFLPVS